MMAMNGWRYGSRPNDCSAPTDFPITVNAENFYLKHYPERLTLM
jgi:hypothetical protein